MRAQHLSTILPGPPQDPAGTMELKTKHIQDVSLPTGLLDLEVDADGRGVHCACIDGGVYHVDIESGKRHAYGKHTSYASGVVRRGSALISSGYDGKLLWHDVDSHEKLREVKAHRFWSWQLAASTDGRWVASASGQYLCGGYKYEPQPADEPTVCVFHVADGTQACALELLAPVQCVAFSPDGDHVAAGNLMGDVAVWRIPEGELVAKWRTPSFTGWGIIKGHYYTGGLFDIVFLSNEEVLVTGMGSTRDPAAGNGRQLWQRFAWRENPVRKIAETKKGDSGQGLMEALAIHPGGGYFFMGGRVHQGKWNGAFFDRFNGRRLASFATGKRITAAAFSADGGRLFVAEALPQKKDKDYGRLRVYACEGGPKLRWL